jgi:hypothetical protein
MKYPSSITYRSVETAALRKKTHRTSWLSALLEALYEQRRRQAIMDIRRHRHLFRRPEHVALYERAVGESRAVPVDRKAAAPIKFSLPADHDARRIDRGGGSVPCSLAARPLMAASARYRRA